MHLRRLLFVGSQTKLTLPHFIKNWRHMATDVFKQWWRKVTVIDLRRDVALLLSSVDTRGKNKDTDVDNPPVKESRGKLPMCATQEKEVITTRVGKRTVDDHFDDADRATNSQKRTRLYLDLFSDIPEVSDVPTHMALDGDFDLAKEVPHLINEAQYAGGDPTLARGRGKPTPYHVNPVQQIHDASSSCKDSHASKGRSIGSHTTSSSSSLVLEMTNNIKQVGVAAMKNLLLQNLKNAPAEEVENVAGATPIYEIIQGLGVDISELRASIDAYVATAKELLQVQKDVDADKERLAHDVSQAEEKLKSSQSSFDMARKASEHVKKQLSLLAQERVMLEASLQTLCEKEANAKKEHQEQLQMVLSAKSEATSLQQKLQDLKTTQPDTSNLRMMQDKLARCKADLDAAMN